MKLVTQTSLIGRRSGFETAVDKIAEAGFDGFDFSMMNIDDEWLPALKEAGSYERVKKLKRFADERGLPCLQAHAPCPSVPKFATPERYVAMTKRAIEYASELECPVLVVHPAGGYTAEENYERIYAPVLDDAARLGVKIATENMFKWKDETETQTVPAACGTAEDFVRHIDYANHPYFTACLDLGHAQMQNCEGATTLIRALGKRIGALHVHDNDLWDDWHTYPFVGKSDWEELTTALAEVGYEGHFTFEADAFMKRFPDELLPYCLKLLERTGRYLIQKIERKKKNG